MICSKEVELQEAIHTGWILVWVHQMHNRGSLILVVFRVYFDTCILKYCKSWKFNDQKV